jgi:hypothetical protein
VVSKLRIDLCILLPQFELFCSLLPDDHDVCMLDNRQLFYIAMKENQFDFVFVDRFSIESCFSRKFLFFESKRMFFPFSGRPKKVF